MSDYSFQQIYKKTNIEPVPLIRRISDPMNVYYK